jgi:hypothetical protein
MNADDYLQRVTKVADQVLANVMDMLERDRCANSDNLRNAILGPLVVLEMQHAAEVGELALEKLKGLLGEMRKADADAIDGLAFDGSDTLPQTSSPQTVMVYRAACLEIERLRKMLAPVSGTFFTDLVKVDAEVGSPPHGTLRPMANRMAKLIVHDIPGPIECEPGPIQRLKPYRPFFEVNDKGEIKFSHPVGGEDVFLHLSVQPDSLYTFENRGTAHVNCHCPGCSSRGRGVDHAKPGEDRTVRWENVGPGWHQAAADAARPSVLEQSCGAARKFTLDYLGLRFWSWNRRNLEAMTVESPRRLVALEEAFNTAMAKRVPWLVCIDADYHVTPDGEVVSGLELMKRGPSHAGK